MFRLMVAGSVMLVLLIIFVIFETGSVNALVG